MSKDYNSTLNLPKTEFSMKAGLPTKEPEMLKEWKEKDIYNKLMKKNEGKPLFVLHDGPPYANGNIHLGTAMNKTLKDFIVRYKNMSGFKAPFVPGWDTHGLPTELKARAKAGVENSSTISDIELRKLCREFTLGYLDDQRNQFKRLGGIADWNNPYITLKPEFEAKQIEIFADMACKGYIYKGLKPVYWCSECETALAEAEIEYADDNCDSIFVKFKVKEDNGNLKNISNLDLENTYFVIWTTTTWTLPGNVAICVGPEFNYSVIKCENEYYIMAEELYDSAMKSAGKENYSVVGSLKGKDLEYVKAYHPFLNRESMVIVGDHVTLESGTGCVHTAPGHGVEDFEVCKNYPELPVIVPVDQHGKLTEEAGQFKGLTTAKANEQILAHLKDINALFATQKIVHSYPHCWRCKKPVLFRATEQWFCSVESFKEAAKEAIKTVKWIPSWGEDRITSMVQDRNDWCISRQRKWGVPIPIFFCKECGEPLIEKEAMLAVSEMFRKEGSDSWFAKDASEILPKHIKCKKCGCGSFDKEKDIMDVWFDSGTSHAAVCAQRPELKWPADLYLEGADQYRGWFQSSLLTSVATNGKAPYKAVVSHGWVVDGEGRKQSKSLGNGILPEEVINEYGADILRLWVASSDYHADVRISKEILKQLSESYRKIRNTARYILGNLYDFNPDEDCVDINELMPIDKWAICKLNELNKKVINAYDNFEFHKIYHDVHKFCVVDMSNFYLDILKDRLYVEKSNSKQRRAAQTTIFIVLDTLTRLISPILAYTSEEIWKQMPHKKDENIESIVFNNIPEIIDISVSEEFAKLWDKIHEIRNDVKKALELARKNKIIGSPLDSKVILHCEGKLYEFIKSVEPDLKMVFIASQVEVVKDSKGEIAAEEVEGLYITVVHAEGEKCNRCWTFSNEVGKIEEHSDLCPRCAAIIK